MPSRTSRTSAPTASHRLATALTKRQLGGQEGVGGVLDGLGRGRVGDDERAPGWRRTGRPPGPPRPGRRPPPRSGRGAAQSWTAVPSRRNSGFETTGTSGPVEQPLDQEGRSRPGPSTCSPPRPRGPGGDRSRRPPPRGRSRRPTRRPPGGWGRRGRRSRRRPRPLGAPSTKRSRPEAEPLAQQLVQAVLHDGGLPAREPGHLGLVELAAADLVARGGPDTTAVVSPT